MTKKTSKSEQKDLELPLQVEAFVEEGLTPVLATFVSDLIRKAEDTYSRLLILTESVSGEKREQLLLVVQKIETVPQELSRSFLSVQN